MYLDPPAQGVRFAFLMVAPFPSFQGLRVRGNMALGLYVQGLRCRVQVLDGGLAILVSQNQLSETMWKYPQNQGPQYRPQIVKGSDYNDPPKSSPPICSSSHVCIL